MAAQSGIALISEGVCGRVGSLKMLTKSTNKTIEDGSSRVEE